MKWLPIILALVFFKLTVLPSCESSSCCSETLSVTDNDTPTEEGDCTSFCMCLHCGYTTVLEQQSELIDQNQDEFSPVVPTYTESYVHHYAKSLWHPPLMG